MSPRKGSWGGDDSAGRGRSGMMARCTRRSTGPLIPATRRVPRPGTIAPPRGPYRHPARRSRSFLHRGCQDQADAHGQDPCAVLPHRRRRLAHQARRPGHRGDRQVPPHRRALAHRGRLRPRAVLALRRRAADRAGRRAPEGHRRLAEVQGPAGRRGHPAPPRGQGRQEGPVRGGGEGVDRRAPGAGATTPKKKAAKKPSAGAEPPAAEPPAEDAPRARARHASRRGHPAESPADPTSRPQDEA